MNVIRLATAKDHNSHGPQRSTPGQGEQCFVYVLGRADGHADSIVSRYGKITAGCGGNLNEDFAKTRWPVVVKVKPHVVEGDLVQHLRDLADLIAGALKPEDLTNTLAETYAYKDWGSPGEDAEE